MDRFPTTTGYCVADVGTVTLKHKRRKLYDRISDVPAMFSNPSGGEIFQLRDAGIVRSLVENSKITEINAVVTKKIGPIEAIGQPDMTVTHQKILQVNFKYLINSRFCLIGQYEWIQTDNEVPKELFHYTVDLLSPPKTIYGENKPPSLTHGTKLGPFNGVPVSLKSLTNSQAISFYETETVKMNARFAKYGPIQIGKPQL